MNIKSLSLLFIVTLLMIPAAHAEEIEMEVHGMACSFCAYGLEKKVNKLEGVESFSVDVKTGIARLKTKEGVVISPEVLQATVKDAGLKLEGTKIIHSAHSEPEMKHDHANESHGGNEQHHES